ncbi:MAG: hypothetical protein AMJ90_02875 [candidate division Zixibacteria bacterium SM23_73_2]|nr:MAG: hypothetical protein AMJ90_02875 [candidate division Zixibacteria bacterium SM23_73_2]
MKISSLAKKKLLEICKRIYDKGFVAANDGNVSLKLGNKILVTPTGKSKGFLESEDLVLVDLKGKKLKGKLNPTSELMMHTFIYEKREDAGAVVHAHPPYSTALAAAKIPLPEFLLPEVILSLGKIPLAPYATPSTREVCKSIEGFIQDHDAIIMENHGVVTVGKDLDDAFFKLERTEHYSRIYFLAKNLGGIKELTKKEIERILKTKEKSV